MKTNYKQGICSSCQQSGLIVHKSKNLCVKCLSKVRISRQLDKKKQRVKDGLALDPSKLSVFYQSYWNRNPVRFCYECGIELKKYFRWHIHHIIPKKEFKNYDLDIVYNDANCMYLCLECHSKAETNLETTPRVREVTEAKRREFQHFSKKGNGPSRHSSEGV